MENPRGDVVSLVTDGVMHRMYRRFGTFLAHEWREFGRLLGVRFVVTEMPGWLPAVRVENTILLRMGLPAIATAWWAWHELGHILLHPNNVLVPLGWQSQAKQERQANEFAASFPIWDRAFDMLPAAVVSWDAESEWRYVGCLWGGGA